MILAKQEFGLHCSLVMCTDTYPGAITDNDLTAGCGVLDMIKDKGATVLTDNNNNNNRRPVSCQRFVPQSPTNEVLCAVRGK